MMTKEKKQDGRKRCLVAHEGVRCDKIATRKLQLFEGAANIDVCEEHYLGAHPSRKGA